MGKLLMSDFIRMKKSLVFKFCVLAMFIIGIVMSVSSYYEKLSVKELETARAENTAFGYTLIVGFLSAIFCNIFQCEEYCDGTVRNKLVIGHTRRNIYLSQVFVSFVAGLIMCLAYTVPALIVGMLFFGGFKELAPYEIIGYYIAGIMFIAVCTALFSFISVCIPTKLGSAAICFLVTLVIIYIALYISQTLDLPEYTFRIIDGVPVNNALNPRYPDENKRVLLESIFDIIPSGQAYQLCYRHADNTSYMIVWDFVITGLLLVSGVFKFRRKDIK